MPTSTARLTEDTEAVTRLRLAVGRTARRLRSTDAGRDLTPTQLSVLAATTLRESIPLSELARLEAVNPTMLSRIVAKLEARGLVARVADPDDRRAAHIRATQAGQALQTRIAAERTSALMHHLRGLPDEHLTSLHAALPALEALADALQHD
ncbi:MAG: MarR family transcriptional regulator [Frankiales bacterium]|nr:MarR family transcriptional regulator [Frankiales bacterium]